MDLNLKDKVALVCASTAGIGKAIALGLAKEGARVAIFGRDPDRLETARAEIEAASGRPPLAMRCDISELEQLDEVLTRTRADFGEIDILVNNQGGPKPGGSAAISLEELRVGVETNLLPVFYLTQACLPAMKQRGWGRVINVLSLSGKEPLPGMVLSNILRPAVLGYAKTIATEYAASGITVNSVLPAAVLTERTATLVRERAEKENVSYEDALAASAQSLPPRYIASPEEFAQLAIFLCSHNAAYVNGAAISVDGGRSRGLF